jgi:hypothetical protein
MLIWIQLNDEFFIQSTYHWQHNFITCIIIAYLIITAFIRAHFFTFWFFYLIRKLQSPHFLLNLVSELLYLTLLIIVTLLHLLLQSLHLRWLKEWLQHTVHLTHQIHLLIIKLYWSLQYVNWFSFIHDSIVHCLWKLVIELRWWVAYILINGFKFWLILLILKRS